MSDILTKSRVWVYAEQDRVVLQVGRAAARMPYALAIKVAQGLKLGAKEAMRISKESRTDWSERSNIENIDLPITGMPIPSTQDISARKTWEVAFAGEDVVLKFDDTELRFHFEIALLLQRWLFRVVKEAKKWAGDDSKSLHVMGSLTDAERNYKYGLH